jgi:hypothetical protein
MSPDEKMNLDSWRINRTKARREDDLLIDNLCDTLLQLQNLNAELEERIRVAFLKGSESPTKE